MGELWNQLGVPLILAIGGGIGSLITLKIRAKFDEQREVRARLSAERRKTYLDVLDPFIALLSKKAITNPPAQKRAVDRITSPEYQRNRSELTFFGSDEVVRAYNELMQHTFHSTSEDPSAGEALMSKWGALLLAVRRDLGNGDTDLDRWDMVAGFLTDVDNARQD